MRRQEYERRRKEYEEVAKVKRKVTPKSKKKDKDGAPPKKRQRKGAKTQAEPAQIEAQPPEVTYESFMEGLMQQLRQMPLVPLQEPEVPLSHAICPIMGSNLSGKLVLRLH